MRAWVLADGKYSFRGQILLRYLEWHWWEHCEEYVRTGKPRRLHEAMTDDDWGVCTVREIQQATIYGGIESFRLHRSGLECDFEASVAKETGYRRLRISFDIDEQKWRNIAATARVVFRECSYFTLLEAPPN